MRLRQFFDSQYVPSRLLGSSIFTVKAYETAISCVEKAFKRPVKLADLQPSLLPKFVLYMRSQDLSSATINNRTLHIRCLWREAWRRGLVKDAPPAARIPEPRLIKPAWTVDEVSRIIASCQWEVGKIGGVPSCQWWTCLILVIYDTGCRRRVIMHTPLANVFWDQSLILLPGKWQKQKADQFCAISDQTVAELLKIKDPSRAALFPWPYDQSLATTYPALSYHFKGILKRAGLEPSGALFHRLRRTRASYGEKAVPGSAQKDLGHSDPKVTQRYLDPRILGTSRTVDLIPRPVC